MACLIVTDQIRVQLNNSDVAVPVEDVIAPGSLAAQRSALQRPDMNRMRLAAMLRRTRSGPSAVQLGKSLNFQESGARKRAPDFPCILWKKPYIPPVP
ncbi:MAG: hypothetical protein HYU57_02120 [Micavibrio aeruginosavorus]|nr:hypothetical protein [Micavibrio aeruginosavorus]